MSWVVGIDLGDERVGVLHFARWFRGQTRARRCIGVHVVDSSLFGAGRTQLVEQARRAFEQAVRSVGAEDDFEELVVLEASRVEEALHGVCIQKETTGLIVGRRVGNDEQRLVRLGAVTRRLLRRLPAPIIVVPPNLDLGTLGGGPVVAAITAAAEVSLSTYDYAQDLAAKMQRELHLIRVAEDPHGGTAYLTPELIKERWDAQVRATEQEFSSWMKAHDVHARGNVLRGRPLEQILAYTKRVGAPLLVCGRNKSTATQRFLGGSAATELASAAEIPTVVIAHTG